MKIVDIERKGNVVRFYLGKKTDDWGWTNPDYKDSQGNTPDWLKPSDRFYGDDWDDAPYEHNADRVYDQFIYGYVDKSAGFDDLVLMPADGDYNSDYCKNDFISKTPYLIVVEKKAIKELDIPGWCDDSYDSVHKPIADYEAEHGRYPDGVYEYYLGDDFNDA